MLFKNKSIKIPLDSVKGKYEFKLVTPALGWNVICGGATVLTLLGVTKDMLLNEPHILLALQLTYLTHVAIIWFIERLMRRTRGDQSVVISNQELYINNKKIHTEMCPIIEVVKPEDIVVPFFSAHRIEKPAESNMLIFTEGVSKYHILFYGDIDRLVDNTR